MCVWPLETQGGEASQPHSATAGHELDMQFWGREAAQALISPVFTAEREAWEVYQNRNIVSNSNPASARHHNSTLGPKKPPHNR